jgi:hypothetical protein
MTTTVDSILEGLDREVDEVYWTAERIEDLEIIKLFSTYWAEIATTLDKIPVTIRLTYNEVDAGYFADILAADGSIDAKGLGVRTNADMLDGLALSELGRLFIIDLEKGGIDPTFDDLGARFALCYLPRAAK